MVVLEIEFFLEVRQKIVDSFLSDSYNSFLVDNIDPILFSLSTDVIGKQIRIGGGFYPSLECAKAPFDLPVIYEDDHMAIGKNNMLDCFISHSTSHSYLV